MKAKIGLVFGVLLASVTSGVVVHAGAKANHIVKIGSKTLRLPATAWVPMSNAQPAVAENFSSTRKRTSTLYSQVLTIFKLPMSVDRRTGLHVSKNEFVEAFVVHRDSVTIQVRVDRGSYWVLPERRSRLIDLSRWTFLVKPASQPPKSNKCLSRHIG